MAKRPNNGIYQILGHDFIYGEPFEACDNHIKEIKSRFVVKKTGNSEWCSSCAHEDAIAQVVKTDELLNTIHALADKWRHHREYSDYGNDSYNNGVEAGFERSADELEELVYKIAHDRMVK